MSQIAIELIPDPEIGGFTARIPDIPEAFGLDDLLARLLQPIAIPHLDWDLRRLAHG